MTFEERKAQYRRFEVIGDEKALDSFERLSAEKKLSRDDLKVILEAVMLRPGIEW